WATAKQRHVPAALLGRVSSLDWLISTGLLPLSYAVAGPVSGAIGARTTLIGAGLLGGVVTFAALYVPGVRAGEGAPARGSDLPDAQGLAALHRLKGEAPDVAVLVLAGLDDERRGVEAVAAGAQDYLVKGQTDGQGLSRAVRYAVERRRADEARQQLELARAH